MNTDFIFGLFFGFLSGIILFIIERKRNSLVLKQLEEEKEKRIRAETEWQALKSKYENFDQIIKNSVKTEVLEAFQKSNEQLLQISKNNIEKNLQVHSNKLDSVIKPFEQIINDYKQKVELFFKDSSDKLSRLNEVLSRVSKQNQELNNQTQNLIKILQSPIQRGKWGEMQLKRIFEVIGFNKGVIYEEQVKNKNHDRADFIINLPDERKIIIDVKLSLSAYWNYMEAKDDNAKKQFAQKHVKDVKNSINELSKKEYWKKYEHSLDYIILYIPIEAAFALALSTETNLFVEALKNKIILASPSTIIALLQMIDAMWRQNEAYKTVKDVVEEISVLRERYAILLEHLNDLGKKISDTVISFNNLLGSWKNRFDPQLRKIENFKKGKTLSKLPNPIDKQINSVK